MLVYIRTAEPCLDSGTKEIFIRTGLSHWVIARTSAEVGEVKLDVTILPKTVGKEGSLIDADGGWQ